MANPDHPDHPDHIEHDETEPASTDSIESTDGIARSPGDRATGNAKPAPSLRDQLVSGSWKPARISGNDLARLVAERRHTPDPADPSGLPEGQRTGEDTAGHRRIRGGVVAIVLVTVLVVLATVTEMSHSNHEKRRESNAAQITALEQSLAQARRRADVTGRAEALSGLVEEATKAADAVAVGQQRYAELAYAANPNPSATSKVTSPPENGAGTRGDGVPGPSALAMVQQRRVLARYWSEDSLVVGPAEAYVFDTVDPFGPGQVDPRWPWYLHYDGPRAADPATYEWTRLSIAPATEQATGPATEPSEGAGRAPRLVKVVWVCEETKTGDVLAWASADYDAGTGRLRNLDLTTSSHATRPTAPTAARTAAPTSESDHRSRGGKEGTP